MSVWWCIVSYTCNFRRNLHECLGVPNSADVSQAIIVHDDAIDGTYNAASGRGYSSSSSHAQPSHVAHESGYASGYYNSESSGHMTYLDHTDDHTLEHLLPILDEAKHAGYNEPIESKTYIIKKTNYIRNK